MISVELLKPHATTYTIVVIIIIFTFILGVCIKYYIRNAKITPQLPV